MDARVTTISRASFALVFVVSACGGIYRYPCQDPVKAKTSACSCDTGPRTKNKAFGVNDPGTTTTTVSRLVGFDC
jgi:hypothetical protein